MGGDAAREVCDDWRGLGAMFDQIAGLRILKAVMQHMQRGGGREAKAQLAVFYSDLPFAPAALVADKLSDRKRVKELVGHKEEGRVGQIGGGVMPCYIKPA